MASTALVTALVRSECSPDEAFWHLMQVQGVSRCFNGFADEELQLLTGCFALVAFGEGEVVFEEGEPYTWAGVVVSGVVCEQDGAAAYRAGDVIGEASLFTTTVCEAQHVGHVAGLIACTTLAQIGELAAARPALSLKLLKAFAEAAFFHAMGFGRAAFGVAAPAAAAPVAAPVPDAEAGAALLLADRNAPLLREWARGAVETLGWYEEDVRELAGRMRLSRLEKHERLERVGRPRHEFGLVLRGALAIEGPQGEVLCAPGGYFGVHAWGLAPEGVHVRVVSDEAVVARAPLADVERLLADRPALMAGLVSDVVRHFLVAARAAADGAGVEKVLALSAVPPPVVRAAEAAAQRLRSLAPAVPDPSRFEGDGASGAEADSTLALPLDLSITAAPESWGVFFARRLLRKPPGADGRGRSGGARRPSRVSKLPLGNVERNWNVSSSSALASPAATPTNGARALAGCALDPSLLRGAAGAPHSGRHAPMATGAVSAAAERLVVTDGSPMATPTPSTPVARGRLSIGMASVAGSLGSRAGAASPAPSERGGELRARLSSTASVGGDGPAGAEGGAAARLWMVRHARLEAKLRAQASDGERLETEMNSAVSYTHLTLPTTPYV